LYSVGAEGRIALGGVEDPQPAAGSRAEIHEPTSRDKGSCGKIHRTRDLRYHPAHRGRNLAILQIDQAQDFESTLGIERVRYWIYAFRANDPLLQFPVPSAHGVEASWRFQSLAG